MATALSQYFGIISIIDCTDDFVSMTLLGFIFGTITGAVGYHWLKRLD